jgi:hypothetical protein
MRRLNLEGHEEPSSTAREGSSVSTAATAQTKSVQQLSTSCRGYFTPYLLGPLASSSESGNVTSGSIKGRNSDQKATVSFSLGTLFHEVSTIFDEPTGTAGCHTAVWCDVVRSFWVVLATERPSARPRFLLRTGFHISNMTIVTNLLIN